MTKPTCLGVHIYNGGFTLGAQQTGFRVLAHCETRNSARKHQDLSIAMLRYNMPDVPTYHGYDEWPTAPGPIDLIVANPPCSLWSQLGDKDNRGRRIIKDPANRLACVDEVMRSLIRYSPRVFCMESLFPFTRSAAYVQLIAMLGSLGYETHCIYHDTKFLGLAQQRRRLFILGSRTHLNTVPPPPAPRRINLDEVIRDLPDPGCCFPVKPQWMPLWVLAGNLTLRRTMKKYDMEDIRPIPAMVRKRAAMNRPLWTMTKPLYIFHDEQPRTFGMREASVVMGFPRDWEWHPTVTPTYSNCTWQCRGVTPAAGSYAGLIAHAAFASTQPAIEGTRYWNYVAPTKRIEDYRTTDWGEIPGPLDGR